MTKLNADSNPVLFFYLRFSSLYVPLLFWVLFYRTYVLLFLVFYVKVVACFIYSPFCVTVYLVFISILVALWCLLRQIVFHLSPMFSFWFLIPFSLEPLFSPLYAYSVLSSFGDLITLTTHNLIPFSLCLLYVPSFLTLLSAALPFFPSSSSVI